MDHYYYYYHYPFIEIDAGSFFLFIHGFCWIYHIIRIPLPPCVFPGNTCSIIEYMLLLLFEQQHNEELWSAKTEKKILYIPFWNFEIEKENEWNERYRKQGKQENIWKNMMDVWLIMRHFDFLFLIFEICQIKMHLFTNSKDKKNEK